LLFYIFKLLLFAGPPGRDHTSTTRAPPPFNPAYNPNVYQGGLGKPLYKQPKINLEKGHLNRTSQLIQDRAMIRCILDSGEACMVLAAMALATCRIPTSRGQASSEAIIQVVLYSIYEVFISVTNLNVCAIYVNSFQFQPLPS
jgi:hypothetical protein